jgi:hypothetical protein
MECDCPSAELLFVTFWGAWMAVAFIVTIALCFFRDLYRKYEEQAEYDPEANNNTIELDNVNVHSEAVEADFLDEYRQRLHNLSVQPAQNSSDHEPDSLDHVASSHDVNDADPSEEAHDQVNHVQDDLEQGLAQQAVPEHVGQDQDTLDQCTPDQEGHYEVTPDQDCHDQEIPDRDGNHPGVPDQVEVEPQEKIAKTKHSRPVFLSKPFGLHRSRRHIVARRRKKPISKFCLT